MPGYYEPWQANPYECSKCGWRGTGAELTSGEITLDLTDYCCPACFALIECIAHPTVEETRAYWGTAGEDERKQAEVVELLRDRFVEQSLKSPDQLPEIDDRRLVLVWDIDGELFRTRTLIRWGQQVIFSEPAVYEGFLRFDAIAKILKEKYGDRLEDLVPTKASMSYLLGDSGRADREVARTRQALRARSGLP